MQQNNLTSYFMLWLNQQQPTTTYRSNIFPSQVVEKNIDPSLTQDNSSDKNSFKNNESQEKSDNQSAKQATKNLVTFKDEKDPDFNLKKQKKNRNVLSNLVHHLMKYLAHRPQTQQYVSKIIEFNHMKIQVDQFYLMLEQLTKILKSYVTQKSLNALWLGQLIYQAKNQKLLCQQFGKIMRIVSRKFYKQTCRSSIFFSNKLSLESKELHYRGLHEIYELLYIKEKTKGKQDKKVKAKK